jgi:hypothetical protein
MQYGGRCAIRGANRKNIFGVIRLYSIILLAITKELVIHWI